MSRNRSDDRNDDNDGVGSFWGTIAAVGAGAAALAGGIYLLTRAGTEEEPQAQSSRQAGTRRDSPELVYQSVSETDHSISNYVTELFDRMESPSQSLSVPAKKGVSRCLNIQPKPTNLNALLSDIYVEYIALKDDDFELYYRVFTEVFYRNIHKKMKEVDKYYNKYYSTVQFAGSHYDSLRIDKPDEFDMDILIDLPLNLECNPNNKDESDIGIEPKAPGFVQLKMGKQFQRLPFRDGKEWEINKTAYEWKDDRNYLLSSKFIEWFKGLVDRTLNTFPTNGSKYLCYVDGVAYTISKSESGPAITLILENNSSGFKMDFDLVPALKFPESRWPVSAAYRKIPPNCNASQKTWMVVPKPIKTVSCSYEKSRSWRVALHEQERGLMYNKGNMKQAIRLCSVPKLAKRNTYHKCNASQKTGMVVPKTIKTVSCPYEKSRSWRVALHEQERGLMYNKGNMKQAIRLIKKLRDAQGMKKIASYYVKTLFFWEAMEKDVSFWNNNPATIFKEMVKKFYEALVAGRIPYFWNKDNNLIGQVDRDTLVGYANKLSKLLDILEKPAEYKKVAIFLLTPSEYQEYNEKRLQ